AGCTIDSTGVAATGGSADAIVLSPGITDSTITSPLPFCATPMRCAAAYDRSMMRSCRKGPRSLTRTTTLCPVATLVTRAYDGSGSVGCAAVIAYMSYGSPIDVFCPWNLRPYHDATPRSWYGVSIVAGTYSRPSTA